MSNEYQDYPKNAPTADDYYLVSVKHALILRLGLAAGPDILIARFSPVKHEWTTGVIGNITNEVIAWRDIPKPQK